MIALVLILSAEANSPGSRSGVGLAANAVSRRAVDADVRLFKNHGGLGNRAGSPWRTERGNGRNGARTTVF